MALIPPFFAGDFGDNNLMDVSENGVIATPVDVFGRKMDMIPKYDLTGMENHNGLMGASTISIFYSKLLVSQRVIIMSIIYPLVK